VQKVGLTHRAIFITKTKTKMQIITIRFTNENEFFKLKKNEN